MNIRVTAIVFVAASIVSTFALAQGSGGPGRGAGIGRADTPGWALMTPEERNEHRAKMLGFTRYDDCAAYLAQHHQLMLERAKEKVIPKLSGPK